MRNQRTFDLDRAEPVAGDIQYIVDPAHDPVVTVFVAAGVVAGQVLAGHLAPIHFLVAVIIAPDAAEHAGPGMGHHEPAALIAADGLARRVNDCRQDAGQRFGAAAGLGGNRAGQRAHHDAARFRLPPGIDDGAALAADHAVVPHPCLGVDSLAHRAQQPQARQVVLLAGGDRPT